MRLEQLRKAYKLAENVSVDYSGMTPEEIKELDDALDTVFKLTFYLKSKVASSFCVI